jgi:alpha-beta hydrolase superfamily lysophospholipase
MFIHGTADRVTDHKATAAFFSEIESSNKRLELLDDGDHVVWVGPHNESCFQLVIGWFKALQQA